MVMPILAWNSFCYFSRAGRTGNPYLTWGG
jgi:hypothetical protein